MIQARERSRVVLLAGQLQVVLRHDGLVLLVGPLERRAGIDLLEVRAISGVGFIMPNMVMKRTVPPKITSAIETSRRAGTAPSRPHR